MTDERLGDRVSISDISSTPVSGGLPHPKDGNMWGNSSSIDQPFGTPSPAGQQRQTGVVTPYDPTGGGGVRDPLSEAAASRQAAAAEPRSQAHKGLRPVPQVGAISKKETAVLKKFRELFGLKRIDVVDVTVLRRDPSNPSLNIPMTFGLRGINYEDYQWALEKTRELLQSPTLSTFAWKHAFISIAVCSLDGEPIWSALGFEAQDPNHVRDPMYPHLGLRLQAAETFSEELKGSLFDTIENLYALYEEKVDSSYLPRKVDNEPSKDSPKSEEPKSPLTQTA